MLERTPIEAKARVNPFLKEKSRPDAGITYGGKKISEWIIENTSPAEIGLKHIVLLQNHHTHYHITNKPSEPSYSSDLENEFNERADRWEKQTGIHSSPAIRYMHRDYQCIIAKGSPVIPLILNRMRKKPNDWFWALRFLADDYDAAENANGFTSAIEAWLKWGVKNGYIAE